MEESNKKIFKWVVGGLVSLVLVLMLSPFTIVSAGERVVILHLGKVDRILSEGIHWVTPLIESTEKFNVTTLKEEVTSSAASKDLQAVSAKIAVNYNLKADRVGDLWIEFKGSERQTIIDPSIQEAVKAATAKYTAEELIVKRESVRAEIQEHLIERLAPKNIIVTQVSIIDFDFSAQFNEAIESKVRAEQQALKAKNDLSRIEFEAQQKIATAEAEAKSIRLQ